MTTASTARIGKPGSVTASWSRRGLGLLLGQRLCPLWILAAAVLVVFNAFRAGLLLLNAGFVRDVGSVAVLRCFGTGFRYDIVPLGYMLLPMLLLSLCSQEIFSHRRFQRAVTGYATGVLTLVLAVEVIGAAFFASFYRRLNWAALNYPRHPKEIVTNIWMSYPLWLFLPLTILGAYLIYRLLWRWFWGGTVPREPISGRLVRVAILVGLAVLACRGGLDHRPLCSGSAYFSSNNVISQLTMNNFFTLFRAARSTLTDGKNEVKDYPFPPLAVAQQVTSRMLLQKADESAGSGANPLWRKTVSPRPLQDCNVVIIMMESMAGPPVGALGYSPSYTANLDALCDEGLFFERMYAVGSRTSRGMMGVLCSHPDLTGVSVLERQRAQGNFLTLPAILRDRGYETLFIYGGDSNFDNMKGFFSAGGIETFIEQKDMVDASQPAGCWGFADEIIFAKAHETFQSLGDKKFFAVLLTVSNHRPYDVPSGRVPMLPDDTEENRRLNAYRYADWALGEFFRRASKAPYFQNTLFVLVADHGDDLNPVHGIDVPGFRVPCLFYAPGRVAPRRVPTVSSQTDIAPTLLALLGGSYEHCFLGRDILSVEEEAGFALLHHDDYLGFVQGDRALVIPPEPRQAPSKDQEPIPVLFELSPFAMTPIPPERAEPAEVEVRQLRMLSYYMIARHLYATGAYHRPEELPNVGPHILAAE